MDSSNIRLDPQIEEKFKHNEELLVNQLPDEVLSIVFFFTILWDLDDDIINDIAVLRNSRPGRVGIRENKPVVYASHVCRHWRVVAMNDPTLWSHWSFFDIKNPSWFVELERRSRGAPILVRTVQDVASSADYVLPRHTSRFRQLEYILVGTPPFGSVIRPHLLYFPHPILETLTLVFDDVLGEERQSPIPNPLFGGNASCLTELRLLRGVPVAPNTTFGHLKRLTISTVSQLHNNRFKWIGSLATLEVLELIDCRNFGPIISTVDLPKLKSLKLSGYMDQCSPWYGAISHPPGCLVSISALVTRRESEIHVPALYDLQDAMRAKASTFSTSSANASHWDISLEEHVFKMSMIDQHQSAIFQLSLRLVESNFNFANPTYFRNYAYPFLVNMSHFLKTVDLRIGDSRVVHRELVETLRTTRRLTLDHKWTLSALLIYLEQNVADLFDEKSSFEPRFFPVLREVEMHNLDFRDPVTQDQVANLVTTRSHCRHPIELIDVTRCAFGKLLVSGLEGIKGLQVLF